MRNAETETPYLMLINIKSPQKEHAKIATTLHSISNGTSKAVYFDKHGGAFLFMSKLKAGQINVRFEGVLLNDDTFFIVELGQDWVTFGQAVAAGWLKTHLG